MGTDLHGILLDEAFLCEIAEILVEEDMHFLHCGVGVALLHPVVENRFQVCRRDVTHDFLPNQREYLVLGCTFQPVVCGALYRGEFEHLQPSGEAVFQGFLRFVRVTHLSVELGDVGGNLLLGFRLGLAGEHLTAFDSLLVKVPDDALPAAIGSSEDVTVGGESFLCMVGGSSFRVVLSTTNTTV